MDVSVSCVKVASYLKSTTSTSTESIKKVTSCYSFVLNKSHCPLNTSNTTTSHMHAHKLLSESNQGRIFQIGPQFRGVRRSCWVVWLKSTSTTHKIFQVKYTFSTSTPNQHVTFQNRTQSSPTDYSEIKHKTINVNLFFFSVKKRFLFLLIEFFLKFHSLYHLCQHSHI